MRRTSRPNSCTNGSHLPPGELRGGGNVVGDEVQLDGVLGEGGSYRLGPVSSHVLEIRAQPESFLSEEDEERNDDDDDRPDGDGEEERKYFFRRRPPPHFFHSPSISSRPDGHDARPAPAAAPARPLRRSGFLAIIQSP